MKRDDEWSTPAVEIAALRIVVQALLAEVSTRDPDFETDLLKALDASLDKISAREEIPTPALLRAAVLEIVDEPNLGFTIRASRLNTQTASNLASPFGRLAQRLQDVLLQRRKP